ncbi:MAG: peptidylprolyl isomerase [Rickettsiales bacterium]|jgi:peptidyl-prolyl cis-trans isomerase C|nr:peptidylprolyl isomerase [Rickettsiales bacterium]
MKNEQFVLIVTLLLGAVGCVYLFKNFRSEKKSKGGEIFATSEKGNLTKAEVDKYLTNLEKNFGHALNLGDMKDEEKNVLASEIINGKIILEKAKAEGLANSKEYLERLGDVKENLLKAIFLENLVAKGVTDEMVRAKYDRLVANMKDKKEYEISHIYTREEKDINSALKELEDHSFVDVAAKYSQDPASKDSGGRVGWVLETALTSEFSSVAKKLPINKLSKPFKTEVGWHIIIKTGERDATIPKFEETKNSLRNLAIRDFIKDYSISNTKNLDIKVVN